MYHTTAACVNWNWFLKPIGIDKIQAMLVQTDDIRAHERRPTGVYLESQPRRR